jgi:hypothetical protein
MPVLTAVMQRLPLAFLSRSPDITPVDFFLWCHVKDKDCATMVTGVEDLKTRIIDVITTINRGMLVARRKNCNFDWMIFVRQTLNCAECI